MYDLVFSLVCIFIVIFLVIKSRVSEFDKKVLITLYVYHLIFAYLYYMMSLDGSADAHMYYFSVSENMNSFNENNILTGTYFIKELVYICIKYMNLSYFNVTLLFSSVGYFGFYLLYKLVFKSINEKYLVLLFFIPGLHFWTVATGKDSLMFFAFCSLIYCMHYKRFLLLILILVLIFCIRSQILYLLVFGILVLFTYILYTMNISYIKKMFLFSTLIIIGLVILDFVFTKYFNSDSISLQPFLTYIHNSQQDYKLSSASVNIEEYNILMKVFTFLYRPFFENIDIRYLIVSFENLVYLLLSLYLIINIKYLKINNINIFNITFMTVFVLFMSFIISNMGISIRFKIMIIPMFFYVLSNIYTRRKQLKE